MKNYRSRIADDILKRKGISKNQICKQQQSSGLSSHKVQHGQCRNPAETLAAVSTGEGRAKGVCGGGGKGRVLSEAAGVQNEQLPHC